MKRLLLALALLASPAFAVQPDEILPDPAQEARARALSKELRCLVCRNENIDDSDAQLARDLRLLVRERIAAGDSDDEAMAFITARYGEFVLLNPPATGANLVLWLAGPAALLAGGGLAFAVMRRRAAASEVKGLSAEEEARLRDILKD
ncbi:cytochrome c-type biogenesis protein [Stagnihabitans tardus]|uniref:Cytochrome c-type biogenesis protein n=1 Tax=Stagnihabitans tardus TaxID=2699202 RepID=A0AAE4YFN8_9RHOB|nr:cytochrome c-type biogenesis protein [Stagnihabitans tardus]NBZ88800.1 cytochrome C biogenesis protein CcdA [Stagnihabitans tardus]